MGYNVAMQSIVFVIFIGALIYFSVTGKSKSKDDNKDKKDKDDKDKKGGK